MTTLSRPSTTNNFRQQERRICKSTYKTRNFISKHFDMSKTKMISQVRKHYDFVSKTNKFQYDYLDKHNHLKIDNSSNNINVKEIDIYDPSN